MLRAKRIMNLCTACDNCRLSDLVGADIGLHVGKNFIESFSEERRLAAVSTNSTTSKPQIVPPTGSLIIHMQNASRGVLIRT